MAITAQRLHEHRTYLVKQKQAAKAAANSATKPEVSEFNRGRQLAYGDALAQFDELVADVVVISLVPAEEGPQPPYENGGLP